VGEAKIPRTTGRRHPLTPGGAPVVGLRVPQPALDRIERAAELAGQNRADFMRQALAAAATDLIARSTAAQGLPTVIEDQDVLAPVAALVTAAQDVG
jgi:uncharacterized protein (DUF1778 family)